MSEHFEELDLAFTVVTETWFHEGDSLTELKEEIRHNYNLESIDRVRKEKSRNNPGWGVPIVFRRDRINLTEFKTEDNLKKVEGSNRSWNEWCLSNCEYPVHRVTHPLS